MAIFNTSIMLLVVLFFSGNGLLTQCYHQNQRFLRGSICSEFSQWLVLCFLLLWKSLLRGKAIKCMSSQFSSETWNKNIFLKTFVQNTHQFHIACLDVCCERANYYFVPLNLTVAAEFYSHLTAFQICC